MISGCGNEVILCQTITLIRLYLIDVHTELSNCSILEQTTHFQVQTEWLKPEEMKGGLPHLEVSGKGKGVALKA